MIQKNPNSSEKKLFLFWGSVVLCFLAIFAIWLVIFKYNILGGFKTESGREAYFNIDLLKQEFNKILESVNKSSK